MVTSVSTVGGTAATDTRSGALRESAELGQADFLRLLTVQVSQQDPFDPVDNKEMLAQMAQFSSLSGIADMGSTLEAISDKLDSLTSAITGAKSIANSSGSAEPTA